MTKVDNKPKDVTPPKKQEVEQKDSSQEVKQAQGAEDTKGTDKKVDGGDKKADQSKDSQAKPAVELSSDKKVADDSHKGPDSPSEALRGHMVEETDASSSERSEVDKVDTSDDGDTVVAADNDGADDTKVDSADEPDVQTVAAVDNSTDTEGIDETDTSPVDTDEADVTSMDKTSATNDVNVSTATTDVEAVDAEVDTEGVESVAIDKTDLQDSGEVSIDVELDADDIDDITGITLDGEEIDLEAASSDDDVEAPENGAVLNINVKANNAEEGAEPVKVYKVAVTEDQLADDTLDVGITLAAEEATEVEKAADDSGDMVEVNVSVTRETVETETDEAAAPVSSGDDAEPADTNEKADAPVRTETSSGTPQRSENTNDTPPADRAPASQSSASGNGSPSNSDNNGSSPSRTFDRGSMSASNGNSSSGNDNVSRSNTSGNNAGGSRSTGAPRTMGGNGPITPIRAAQAISANGINLQGGSLGSFFNSLFGNSFGSQIQTGMSTVSNGIGSIARAATQRVPFAGLSNSDIISGFFGNRGGAARPSLLTQTLSPLNNILTGGLSSLGLNLRGPTQATAALTAGTGGLTGQNMGLEMMLAQLGMTLAEFQTLPAELQQTVLQRIGFMPGTSVAGAPIGGPETFNAASLNTGIGSVGNAAFGVGTSPLFGSISQGIVA